MAVQILVGDVRDRLKELPDESVHCVVTSPPYWGLRDYGVAGQIGLESHFKTYVMELVHVFAEVRRVLRSDGTCWMNLGDSYNAHPGQRKPTDKVGTKQETNAGSNTIGSRHVASLKPKDLVGIPWRVAFALQADGWWLRQDIIWSKPNPMPESVTDRCTKAHEYLFLLSKSARYYFDRDAIAEPFADASIERLRQGESTISLTSPTWCDDATIRRDEAKTVGLNANRSSYKPGSASSMNGGKHVKKSDAGLPLNEAGRSKRSVWEVTTQPFKEAHFATFPPALIEPCILAGCPKGGTVLDPFGGAGTTGLVADRLGRNAILIELNPEYAEIARKRIKGDAPLFAEVSA